MIRERKALKFLLCVLVFLAVSSFLSVIPVQSPTVVGPYDWVQVGAYVKYTISPGSQPWVTLSNGSRRLFSEVNSSLFQWTVVDKQESVAQLNVTLYINGSGWYYDPDFGDGKQFTMTHHKTVFVDVDVYSREGFVDGESIGKTSFWADPYGEEGDKVVLWTDPDFLESEVRRVVFIDVLSSKDVKMYVVPGANLDPDAHVGYDANYIFSWYTGVCWQITILGPPYEILPGQIGGIGMTLENGTRYDVLRCAGTKLGEYLGLAPYINNKFWGDFSSTNIDLALETAHQPPEPEQNPEPQPNQTESTGTQLDSSDPLNLSNLSSYIVIICIFIFIVPVIVIIIQRRKHGARRAIR